MKNLFLTIILFSIILSCSEPLQDNWYELSSIPSKLKNTDNAIDIFNWVIDNVDYVSYANNFHSAQKTLDEKKGNCANMALLTLALNYEIRNNKGQLVYCKNGNDGLHYTVRINGKIIEPGIKEIYNIIDFDNIKL